MDLNCHLLSSFWWENPRYESYEVESDNCKHLEDRIWLVVRRVHDCMFVYYCEINGIQHIILHAIWKTSLVDSSPSTKISIKLTSLFSKVWICKEERWPSEFKQIYQCVHNYIIRVNHLNIYVN